MTFLWPELLWTLAALPLLVALYLWLLSRRKEGRGRLLRPDAGARGAGPRRRLAPGICRRCCCCWRWPPLLLATARPSVKLTLPSQRRMLILSMDVSGSMRATDVKPGRMLAMQAAARPVFLQAQPARPPASASSPSPAPRRWCEPPTFTKDDLMAAIGRFNFQHGTAVGSGILVSLQTIFPDMDFGGAAAQRPAALGQFRRRLADRLKPGQRHQTAAPARTAGLLRLGGHRAAGRHPDHHRPQPHRGRAHGRRTRRARLPPSASAPTTAGR
nr:hypothetical protein [Aquabacterium sp. J223]